MLKLFSNKAPLLYAYSGNGIYITKEFKIFIALNNQKQYTVDDFLNWLEEISLNKTIDDSNIFKEIFVVISKRKSMCISINKNCEIYLRCSKIHPQNIIVNFIENKKLWIYKILEKIQSRPKTEVFKTSNYQNNQQIKILGRLFVLCFLNISGKRPYVLLDEQSCEIRIYFNFSNYSTTKTDKLINEFLKKLASEIYQKSLDKAFNFFYTSIKSINQELFFVQKPILQVKNYKAKWGSLQFSVSKNKSCKSSIMLNLPNGSATLCKNLIDVKINLSTRLIHFSLECVDYVVFHELCHLIFQNHSKEFYSLQEYFVPNYKIIKDYLQ